jgi:cobalt-zinc-cadmium efflux system outer membrane protein
MVCCAALAAAGTALPSDGRAEAPAEPTGVLRLDEAVAAALQLNDELAADGFELRAREAALVQAGAHPNPTASLELEDFAGTGDFGGVDSAQTTLLLGQVVELGGKRPARIGEATASRDLVAFDHAERRIDVRVRTADAFVDVLAAQERHRLAEEALVLARELQRVAGLRLRAGIATPAEEIRAGVAVDVAEVEREHTEHELETTRQVLASTWSGEQARFERAEGELAKLPVVPSEQELTSRLEASPMLGRWRAELAQRDARRERARSERIPDVTLHAGPRRLSATDDTAFVISASVPLPLWDRKAAAVDEAQQRVAKVGADAHAARVRAVTELKIARIGLVASSEEAHLLETRVIPGTERAVAALRRGYEQGRFAQIEVIDAERERLGAREQYLRALTEAHHSALEIERLTGVPLEVRP